MLNRRTTFKLKRLHTILKRDIFNSRFIVRNTLVLMILISVSAIIAISVGSMAENKENLVEAETITGEYVVLAGNDSVIDEASISVLRAEIAEPDVDMAAVSVQSVSTTDTAVSYDFVTDADSLNIRANADENAEILGRLMKDSVGKIEEEGTEWTRISSGGITGYVKTEYILTKDAAADRLEDCKKNIATVTAGEVRVRTDASTDADIIIVAKQNDSFVVDASYSGNGWNRIRLADGTYGYISSDYIKIRAAYEEAISMDIINALKEAKEAASVKQDSDKKESSETEKDSDKKSDKKNSESESDKTTEKSGDKKTESSSDKTVESNSDKTSNKDSDKKKPESTSDKDSSDSTSSGNQVTPSTTSRGSFGLSEEDIKLLACIVYAESGSESYEGQLAVANVVLNRLQSGRWGSSVSDVIYASGQFTAVNSSAFQKAMENGPSSTSLSAAQAAAAGTNNIGSFMSFRPLRNAKTDSYSSYTIIGNHCFFP